MKIVKQWKLTIKSDKRFLICRCAGMPPASYSLSLDYVHCLRESIHRQWSQMSGLQPGLQCWPGLKPGLEPCLELVCSLVCSVGWSAEVGAAGPAPRRHVILNLWKNFLSRVKMSSLVWSVVWSMVWSLVCSLVCSLACSLVCSLVCRVGWSAEVDAAGPAPRRVFILNLWKKLLKVN